jgi:hypothetical protein
MLSLGRVQAVSWAWSSFCPSLPLRWRRACRACGVLSHGVVGEVAWDSGGRWFPFVGYINKKTKRRWNSRATQITTPVCYISREVLAAVASLP